MKAISITSKVTYQINEFMTWDEVIDIFNDYADELKEYDNKTGEEDFVSNIRCQQYGSNTYLHSMNPQDQKNIKQRLLYLFCNYPIGSHIAFIALAEQYSEICNYGG